MAARSHLLSEINAAMDAIVREGLIAASELEGGSAIPRAPLLSAPARTRLNILIAFSAAISRLEGDTSSDTDSMDSDAELSEYSDSDDAGFEYSLDESAPRALPRAYYAYSQASTDDEADEPEPEPEYFEWEHPCFSADLFEWAAENRHTEVGRRLWAQAQSFDQWALGCVEPDDEPYPSSSTRQQQSQIHRSLPGPNQRGVMTADGFQAVVPQTLAEENQRRALEQMFDSIAREPA